MRLGSELDGELDLVDPNAPLLVLAHGAGAPFNHPHMDSISDALNREGVSTLRFNFPFMQAGKRRVDSLETSVATVAMALELAQKTVPNATIYLGGHSFGGRMATHLAAQSATCRGLILFSFPLHVSKKPAIARAAHLPDIKLPMLFLSGTRDTLADAPLLEKVVAGLPQAQLHWLDTADHGFKILKRTRTHELDVYTEAATTASAWIHSQQSQA